MKASEAFFGTFTNGILFVAPQFYCGILIGAGSSITQLIHLHLISSSQSSLHLDSHHLIDPHHFNQSFNCLILNLNQLNLN